MLQAFVTHMERVHGLDAKAVFEVTPLAVRTVLSGEVLASVAAPTYRMRTGMLRGPRTWPADQVTSVGSASSKSG